MKQALDVIWLVARRTWAKTLRRPVVLTFSFIQPLMWMTFFGFLFSRYQLDEPQAGGTYLDFLAPGVSAMTVLFGASQAGIGWIRDLQTGFLPRMLNAPTSHHPLLLGKILADVVRLLAQAAVVLALAWLLGARMSPTPEALITALPCLALFAFAFACVSSTIALLARTQEAMATFVHVINMPLLFTSTALVPARQMPDWLATVAAWNPLSLTVDAWRGALLAGETPSLSTHLLPLAIFAAILYVAAASAMRGIAKLY